MAGIDGSRLGVLGPSLAGGHALRLAATEPLVRCVVAIAPFVELQADDAPPELLAAVAADATAIANGNAGGTIPILGRPGDPAVMTSDGALDWLASQHLDLSEFDDHVTLASLVEIAGYRPLAGITDLTAPARVIVATSDTVNPPDLTRAALERFENVDLIELPANHFSLFDEHADAVNALTVEWFARHLERP